MVDVSLRVGQLVQPSRGVDSCRTRPGGPASPGCPGVCTRSAGADNATAPAAWMWRTPSFGCNSAPVSLPLNDRGNRGRRGRASRPTRGCDCSAPVEGVFCPNQPGRTGAAAGHPAAKKWPNKGGIRLWRQRVGCHTGTATASVARSGSVDDGGVPMTEGNSRASMRTWYDQRPCQSLPPGHDGAALWGGAALWRRRAPQSATGSQWCWCCASGDRFATRRHKHDARLEPTATGRSPGHPAPG
jgi:hypothetical protein